MYPYVGNSPTNYVDPSGLCEDPVEFDEFAQRQRAMFQDRGDQLFNSLSLFLRNEYLSKYGISPWDRAGQFQAFKEEFEESLPQQYEVYLARLAAQAELAASQNPWTIRNADGRAHSPNAKQHRALALRLVLHPDK